MKFFIVFACALAAASAGYIAAPVVYGAQHLPVIGPNGVPIDTAEVQHARAAHLVHKIDAHARNGDLAIAHAAPIVAHHAYSGSIVAAAPIVAHGPAAYPTTAVLPSSINGVPLETPEVVAAKINHFAAHNEALARNVHAVHYIKRRGIYAAAPIHYAAQHLPIIGTNGVPVDTAEVQIARAQHLSHKIEAHARNGDLAIAAPIVAHHAPVVASTYAHAAPVVASTYAHHAIAHHAAPVIAHSAPIVASSVAHVAPVVASTYAQAGPVVHSTYAHHAAPVVASIAHQVAPVVAHSAPVVSW